jgi:DNA polymerase-3 subunit alpha
MIRFGSIFQSKKTEMSNSLFGSDDMVEVATPKIPNCETWTLTELLQHEKDTIGIYLSGHPLDHFKFELEHYDITPLSQFNEFVEEIQVESIKPHPNPGKKFMLAGLITNASHRVTKTGKNFANLSIEDYTGKVEFTLWSEDYAKFNAFLTNGLTVLVSGFNKPRMRYNSSGEKFQDGFEFKVTSIYLMETLKKHLTKQVRLVVEARSIDQAFVNFLHQNLRKYKGDARLKIEVYDEKQDLKVELLSNSHQFELNDELVNFLIERPEVSIMVESRSPVN